MSVQPLPVLGFSATWCGTICCVQLLSCTPSVDHCNFDVLHRKSVLQRVQHGRRHAFPLLSLVIFFFSFHIFSYLLLHRHVSLLLRIFELIVLAYYYLCQVGYVFIGVYLLAGLRKKKLRNRFSQNRWKCEIWATGFAWRRYALYWVLF